MCDKIPIPNQGWMKDTWTNHIDVRECPRGQCYSRWFIVWTNSVGRNVVWLVHGWMHRQPTGICNSTGLCRGMYVCTLTGQCRVYTALDAM
jgi:hypothetical protein